MSPHLRNLLEEAADDGGRPVALDLAGLRAAGRRATWRQRAVVGGGAVGAAAVITTVALVLAPGGPSPSGFAPGTPGSPSWEDAVQPLVAALERNGYLVAPSPNLHGLSVAGSSTDGPAPDASLTASSMSVADGDAVGTAIAAEFNDAAALNDTVLGDVDPEPLNSEVDGYQYTEQCAVLPVNVHRADFAWDTCEDSPDGRQRVATGGDAFADAVGVTLLRSDGSGVSLAVSTAAYDRPVGGRAPTAPTLSELPASVDQLRAAAEKMLAAGPVFPPSPGNGIEPGQTSGVETSPPPTGPPVPTITATPPPSLPPDSDPCAEAVPPVDQCESTGADTINARPLFDALAAAGVDAEDVGGTGSGGSDGDVAQSALFRLSDSAGRSGMASIGIANSIESAPLMNDTSIAWCAVTPTYERDYAWQLADDPSTPCSDSDHEVGQPLVVVHDRPDAAAIGATLVRADGSVISVSVTRAPGLGGPNAEPGTPLAELPLDRVSILDLLAQLDAANPAS